LFLATVDPLCHSGCTVFDTSNPTIGVIFTALGNRSLRNFGE